MSYLLCCDAKGCPTQVKIGLITEVPDGWSEIRSARAVDDATLQNDGVVEELDEGGAVVGRKRFLRAAGRMNLRRLQATLRYVVCPAHPLPEPGPQAEEEDDGLAALG